ncbi:hypothetical protein V6N13_111431 [Hibiscus sabdariffa]|uniref:Uncharacterized protein n=1 Tax=Hibiscus sabdariffa TaxID=183260 RepID=A0ABR2TKJ5_9ROSI
MQISQAVVGNVVVVVDSQTNDVQGSKLDERYDVHIHEDEGEAYQLMQVDGIDAPYVAQAVETTSYSKEVCGLRGDAKEAPVAQTNNLLPFSGTKWQTLAKMSCMGHGWLLATRNIDLEGGVILVIEACNIVVEPSVPEQVPEVLGDGLRAKGQHKAISIMEECIMLDGGKRGSLKNRPKGVTNLKLLVRKQSYFKAPKLQFLSEWVNSFSYGGSVDKHTLDHVNSTSVQEDLPDTRTSMHVVHGNEPEEGRDTIEMVQAVGMADSATTLDH